MATGDDIIGSIDQALWRVQSRSVNNITPFTYRDGLTYIDVLERIRSSVIDVITFTILWRGTGQDYRQTE